jgi:SET domain-containing protein
MGLFADRFYEKNSFLGFYGGEYTFTEEDRKREIQLKITETSYVFTSDYRGMQVDALFVGNKMRYMNHMKAEFANVNVKIIASKYRKFIGFYAKKEIQKGEELLFDYGEKYNLNWKLLFDEQVKQFAQKKREEKNAIDKIKINKKHKRNFVQNFIM